MGIASASERGIRTGVTLDTDERATVSLAEHIVSQYSSEVAKHFVTGMGFTLNPDGYVDLESIERIIEGAPTIEVPSEYGLSTLEDVFDGNLNSVQLFIFSGIEEYVMAHSNPETLDANYSYLKQVAVHYKFYEMGYVTHIREKLNTDPALMDNLYQDSRTTMSEQSIQWVNDLMDSVQKEEAIIQALRNSDTRFAENVAPLLPDGTRANTSQDALSVPEEVTERALVILQENQHLLFPMMLLLLSKKSTTRLQQEIEAAWGGVPIKNISSSVLHYSQRHDTAG